MGDKGPVPKRDDERRRMNKKAIPTKTVDVDGEIGIPAADEKWHPIAKRWYEALAESAQTRFYEASDWATAYMLAESISRDLKPQAIGVHPETGKAVMASVPIKGSNLTAYLKGFTSLLVTEGDRRRASVEIQRNTLTTTTQTGEASSLDRRRGRLAA